MTWDPLSLSTIQLLARGHKLYGADYFDAGVVDAPAQLRRRLQQLASVNSAEGIGAARLANLRMAAGLGHNAAAEGELDGVLADARTDHSVGWRGTRRVLDDGYLWLEAGVIDPSIPGPWIGAAEQGPSKSENVHRHIG